MAHPVSAWKDKYEAWKRVQEANEAAGIRRLDTMQGWMTFEEWCDRQVDETPVAMPMGGDDFIAEGETSGYTYSAPTVSAVSDFVQALGPYDTPIMGESTSVERSGSSYARVDEENGGDVGWGPQRSPIERAVDELNWVRRVFGSGTIVHTDKFGGTWTCTFTENDQ